MPDEKQSKRPAPRKETMQSDEVDARLVPHYLPDYNRSVMARDAAHAAELAKEFDSETDEEVTEDQTNG